MATCGRTPISYLLYRFFMPFCLSGLELYHSKA
jgi:hypothetical protein